MTYGYNVGTLTSPGGGSTDHILPLAINLIAELCAERQLSGAFNRPIIFICHGFGGILVKRALVFSSTSRAKNVEHRRSVYLSTYAILFMGTPHTGLRKDAVPLLRRDESAGPSHFTINLLTGSEMLREVTDQFAPIMKQFSIYYFWEQMMTRAGDDWAYIVEKESAAPVWDNVERCGIMTTHSGIVKFENAMGRGYQVVHEALVRYIKDAPELIKLRWANDKKLLAAERQREAENLLQTLPSRLSFDVNSPTDINECYVVHRCSSNYFTGRTMHAKDLRDKFGPVLPKSKRHEHQVFVIHGLGGSGKTQFCLKYVEDNRSRYGAPIYASRALLKVRLMTPTSYWGIFWIDASSEENAESGFAYLGQQAGKGATFGAGKHWLSTCPKSWLLVIDNADDPDMDISKYFPAGGKGHILITTRNPGAVIHATVGKFHFRGMEPDEAITLLLKAAHVPNRPENPNVESRKLAQGIASELGYLALALAHAGATIRRNIYTLEKYLHYYLGYRKEMRNCPDAKNADDVKIITTWEIPFRRIRIRESIEYKDAVDLVHIFAFIHFESIPEKIFQMYWNAVQGIEPKLVDHPNILRNQSASNEEAHARLRRALRVLCDYSIIDHDPDMGICSLHPVIHTWARDRLSPPERTRWLSYTAAVLARCISPNLEASGREFRRLLLPHIDSCLRAMHTLVPSFPESIEQATEIDSFASVYAENGLWKPARKLQRKVIDLRLRKLGKWHEDTIQAQRSLGYMHWNLFEIKSAVEIQAEILKSRWWSRPSPAYWVVWPPWRPEHIPYCIALSDLTMTLWLAGKHALSKQTGEGAVERLMKHLGPDDPITLTAMFNLGRTYLHIGDYQKSHELLVLVVQKRKRFFGPDHADTLMARNELGMSYRLQGRMSIAARLVTNVLDTRKKFLGEEHAYTLWSVNDLSKVMCDGGRPEKAVSMLEEIIPVVQRTLGEEHVGMFMTQTNLARAYGLCERWNDAAVLLRTLTAMIPSEHPDWIHAMSGYVHVRSKLGPVEETESDCKKLVDLIVETKVFALNHPLTLAIAEQLLNIYRAQGRSDETLALKKRVPGINEEKDAQRSLFVILYGTQIRDRKTG